MKQSIILAAVAKLTIDFEKKFCHTRKESAGLLTQYDGILAERYVRFAIVGSIYTQLMTLPKPRKGLEVQTQQRSLSQIGRKSLSSIDS